MPQALDGRPPLARLNARIRKYSGCTEKPLANDIALHQQSIDEIGRLTAAHAEIAHELQSFLDQTKARADLARARK